MWWIVFGMAAVWQLINFSHCRRQLRVFVLYARTYLNARQLEVLKVFYYQEIYLNENWMVRQALRDDVIDFMIMVLPHDNINER